MTTKYTYPLSHRVPDLRTIQGASWNETDQVLTVEFVDGTIRDSLTYVGELARRLHDAYEVLFPDGPVTIETVDGRRLIQPVIE